MRNSYNDVAELDSAVIADKWVQNYFDDLRDAMTNLVKITSQDAGVRVKFKLNDDERQAFQYFQKINSEEALQTAIISSISKRNKVNARILVGAFEAFRVTLKNRIENAYETLPDSLNTALEALMVAPATTEMEVVNALGAFMTADVLEELLGAPKSTSEVEIELEFKKITPKPAPKEDPQDPKVLIDNRTKKQATMKTTVSNTVGVKRDFTGRKDDPKVETVQGNVVKKINEHTANKDHQFNPQDSGEPGFNRQGRYSKEQADINKEDIQRGYINTKAQANVVTESGQTLVKVTVADVKDPDNEANRQEVCRVIGATKLVVVGDAARAVAPTKRDNNVADAHNLPTDVLRQMKKDLDKTTYDEQFVTVRLVDKGTTRHRAPNTISLINQLVNISIKALAAGILPVVAKSDVLALQNYIQGKDQNNVDIQRIALFLEVQKLIPVQASATAGEIETAHEKFRELFLTGEFKDQADAHKRSIPKAPTPTPSAAGENEGGAMHGTSRSRAGSLDNEQDVQGVHGTPRNRAGLVFSPVARVPLEQHEVSEPITPAVGADSNRPDFSDSFLDKYARMQKSGLPDGAILNAMNRDQAGKVYKDLTEPQKAVFDNAKAKLDELVNVAPPHKPRGIRE